MFISIPFITTKSKFHIPHNTQQSLYPEVWSNYWHYINITFFTGWHCRLSTRGHIVERGGAEVDNAFRGVTFYHVTPLRMLYSFYYTECPIFTTYFTAVRHYRVTFKIVNQPIDQSDCWNLIWGIIIQIVKYDNLALQWKLLYALIYDHHFFFKNMCFKEND